jgi:hypothetical protein
MTISGNLNTMHLAEILQWLANGRHTGTLVVSKGTTEKRIYFREGVILSSTSSDPTSFLGHFLVSKGVISEDQLSQAMAIQTEQGGLLGEVLVQGGAVDGETLENMLRLNAEENICDLFGWDEGEFSFLDGELPDRDLVPIGVDVTGLVMEGMRRIDELEAIRELIPSSHCVPVAVALLEDDDELDLGWQGVLEAVDDDRSIEDICLHTHSSEFFVSQVLYGAAREGKVKIVRPRIVTAEQDQAPEGQEEKTDQPLTNAETLIAEALAHLRAGVYETAARHIQAAVSLEPNNRELGIAVRELEEEIRFSLESDGVALASVPVLETTLDDLRALSFSPEEGFILSRINGSSDIASIMKISPLSELDSILVFWKLARSGHIRLQNAG